MLARNDDVVAGFRIERDNPRVMAPQLGAGCRRIESNCLRQIPQRSSTLQSTLWRCDIKAGKGSQSKARHCVPMSDGNGQFDIARR